jgi:Xaa-Pro aminopeptidase
MDVHDVGRYHVSDESRRVEPGMVMTIEPGLYIAPETKDIPGKYLGIGVRIEDDVLITSDGHRVLSDKAPKQVEEIEEFMAHR